MLEQGCIRTGAVCKFPDGSYALGDLFHYSGTYVFRHRTVVTTPPRDYLNGEFIDWRHQWPCWTPDGPGLLITIGTSRDFLYYGYKGRPIG